MRNGSNKKLALLICIMLLFTYYTARCGLSRQVEVAWLSIDFLYHRQCFEEALSEFPSGTYLRINKKDYNNGISSLSCLFERLGYVEIYSDFAGNVYFNKFGDRLTFIGIVYLRKPSLVIDKLKSVTYVYLDNDWIVYYFHGL